MNVRSNSGSNVPTSGSPPLEYAPGEFCTSTADKLLVNHRLDQGLEELLYQLESGSSAQPQELLAALNSLCERLKSIAGSVLDYSRERLYSCLRVYLTSAQKEIRAAALCGLRRLVCSPKDALLLGEYGIDLFIFRYETLFLMAPIDHPHIAWHLLA